MEEEEKIKQRQLEYENKRKADIELRRKQEEERLQKKKQEDEELERLLMEIGENVEVTDSSEPSADTEDVNGQILESEDKSISNGDHIINTTNAITSSDLPQLTKEISFKNVQAQQDSTKEEMSNGLKLSEEEPSNVWASIRKIKESSQNYEALFSSKSDPNVETVSINDIDDMIQQLAQQIANKRIQPCEDSKLDKPSLNKIEEETEELKTNIDSELNNKENVEQKEIKQSNRNSLINTADSNSLKQPFDYEQWKTGTFNWQ